MLAAQPIFGLLAVEGYIALNVLAAVIIGRRRYGSVRAWWQS